MGNQNVDNVKQALLSMQRYSWEQGVTAQAFLELGENEFVIQMAYAAAMRQEPDGRLAVMGSHEASTDPGSNGEALLYASKATGDPYLRQATNKLLDYLLNKAPRSEDGTLYHVMNAPEMWIDALYMYPPFLALSGQPQAAIEQIDGYHERLWDSQKKLYSHIWDEGSQSFKRKDFWGVGNGWAAAGITRVIQALPEEMSAEKGHLIGYVREVLEGCLVHNRKDGLFYNVIDNSNTFIETNLAQMLAYTIYRGVISGWLSAHYLEAAGRMRLAANAKVDKYGFIQGVCGAPDFNHPGIAPEGQAFFLLMEAAYQELKAKRPSA